MQTHVSFVSIKLISPVYYQVIYLFIQQKRKNNFLARMSSFISITTTTHAFISAPPKFSMCEPGAVQYLYNYMLPELRSRSMEGPSLDTYIWQVTW